MHHIFISARALTPKLKPSALAGKCISTDSHNSQDVQVTLQVTPPTSPCPTLSADAEPARKCAETMFSAHCAV